MPAKNGSGKVSANGKASANVRAALALYDAVDRRDWRTFMGLLADDCIWEDRARGITFRSPVEILDGYIRRWLRSFPDATVAEPSAVDGGDRVIVRWIARGTNREPLGLVPATGRRILLHMCDVLSFDGRGKILAGESYFDELTLLVQIGHAQPPPIEDDIRVVVRAPLDVAGIMGP